MGLLLKCDVKGCEEVTDLSETASFFAGYSAASGCASLMPHGWATLTIYVEEEQEVDDSWRRAALVTEAQAEFLPEAAAEKLLEATRAPKLPPVLRARQFTICDLHELPIARASLEKRRKR